jgi:ADP-ribosylglycohydrolase
MLILDKAHVNARDKRDVFAIREPLMELLEWGHLFSESIHTLVVALSMFVASEADIEKAIVGAIMYGRDKDSYASVVGALVGAFHGVDVIPERWIQPVLDGNPAVDMQDYARHLTRLIMADGQKRRANLDAIEALL